jgi:Tfp pilus assembly protein PilV
MSRLRGDDEGLTLIELLISMAVMMVIMTPLVASFVLTLATTTTADQDTTNSADAQVLSMYFGTDVANADSVGVTSSCGGADSVLFLTWLDGATQHVVSYQAVPDAATKAALSSPTTVYRVTRYDCTGGGTPVATVVARSASALPTLRCDAVTCTDATSRPRTVTVTITDRARRAGDPPFVLSLTGTRRVTT